MNDPEPVTQTLDSITSAKPPYHLLTLLLVLWLWLLISFLVFLPIAIAWIVVKRWG